MNLLYHLFPIIGVGIVMFRIAQPWLAWYKARRIKGRFAPFAAIFGAVVFLIGFTVTYVLIKAFGG